MPEEAASAIVPLDNDLYGVSNSRNDGLVYEVYTELGICFCMTDASGTFCKHQALVHSVSGGAFPNGPVLSTEDRYELEKLA